MSKRIVVRPNPDDKPNKPTPDFPLFPHNNGCWAKKVRGRLRYFGPWVGEPAPDHGANAAMQKWLAEKDALLAGREPRADTRDTTVKDLCNAFMAAKQSLRDAGELSPKMWRDYLAACTTLVEHAGRHRLAADLAPPDFESLRRKMAERWGPTRLGNVIIRIKSVFKYGLESGLLDRVVRFGPTFRKPSASVMRRHRASRGEEMLEPDQLRHLLEKASVSVRAWILLGLNCGFGNHDVAALPLAALDLDAGMVDFPRPKTGIERRCPLWPETVAALREAIAARPAPKTPDDAKLALLSARGTRLIRETETSRIDNISNPFIGLLKSAGVHRERLGFYTLRRIHRTIADEARDPVACDLIMGHTDPSMGARYRQRISDERLRAVTDHVRAWLFAAPEAAPSAALETEDEV